MFFLLAVLALSLQSCLGINSSPFQNKNTGTNGEQVGINTTDQAKFKGKIYLTLDRNLYVLDGQGNLKQLTKGMDIRDPAISPDGKWIAFVIRYQNYSNLAYMPSAGGKTTVLISGNGAYVPNPGFAPKATYHWFAQPAWSADGKTLLFLSDLEKEDWYAATGQDAPLLDLQVFSIPFSDPTTTPKDVAYAVYGDGGLRDPSYRPGHPDQITYTSYRYDSTQTQQVIQINIEDANDITNHPGTYYPGFDPAVALTPGTANLVNLEPAFSPDGNSLIYLRRDSDTQMSMYTMPVANGVTSDANTASFNPNSTSNQQKAVAPYNQSMKLLNSKYLSYPIWSPDGKEIAYYTYNNSTFDLWLATVIKDPKIAGDYTLKPNSEVQVTNAQGHLDADSRPCWSL